MARAFNRLFSLRLSTRGEMQYAYEGERLTPSRCGKMDQALAFGCRPVLMTYDGDVLHISPLQLKAPLYLVLVDLRAAKDTVTILSALQVCCVFASTCICLFPCILSSLVLALTFALFPAFCPPFPCIDLCPFPCILSSLSLH